MRTISFILAFALVFAGPSMAGSSDTGLPGIGTFSFDFTPSAPLTSRTILVAAN